MYYAIIKGGEQSHINEQKLALYEYANQKQISNLQFVKIRGGGAAQVKKLNIPSGSTVLFVDLNIFGNSIQEVTAYFKTLSAQGLQLISVNRPNLAEFLIQNSDILNEATSYFAQNTGRASHTTKPAKAAHDYNDYLDRIKELAHQGRNPRQIWEAIGCVGTYRGFAVYCIKKREVKEILKRYGN